MKCNLCGSEIKGRIKSKYKDKNFKIIKVGDIIKTPVNNRFVVDAEFKNLEH